MEPNRSEPSGQPQTRRAPEVADAIQLVCDDCGSVEHGQGLLAQLGQHLLESNDFEARSAEVTVFGLCVHCRQA